LPNLIGGPYVSQQRKADGHELGKADGGEHRPPEPAGQHKVESFLDVQPTCVSHTDP
ncbi:MAG: hypothetical protein QOF35_1374, partial [Actinomycetota bacterium]|nr:hypothetical protein [Actinomycetota bacterium]